MDPNLFAVPNVLAFVLVMIRVSGLIATAPLFDLGGIPPQAKIGVTLALTLILFPFSGASALQAPADLWAFSVLAAQELTLGLILGFAANLLFSGVRIAGEMMGTQMGLSISSVIDPTTHSQAPALAQWYFYLALLLFLSMNVHHSLIIALSRSFTWIPVGHGIAHVGTLTERLLLMSRDMFILAVMFGAPVIGILLLLEVVLAFVAKTMPQMNIFMVSLPLKIAVGFLAIGFSLPYATEFLAGQYDVLIQELLGLYRRS